MNFLLNFDDLEEYYKDAILQSIGNDLLVCFSKHYLI